MSSNQNINTVIPSLEDAKNTMTSQNYDITKEENSKIRYLMSYYGY